MKLDMKAFAIAGALWWGAGMFLLTWWLIALEGAGASAGLLGRVYYGFEITPLGSLAGLAWGLLDGFIGGALLAWLYNRFAN